MPGGKFLTKSSIAFIATPGICAGGGSPLNEHGTLRGYAEELIARLNELVVTEIAAILQFEIESARVAEFQDRRRREGEGHCFVDPPERAHRAAGDSQCFQGL